MSKNNRGTKAIGKALVAASEVVLAALTVVAVFKGGKTASAAA